MASEHSLRLALVLLTCMAVSCATARGGSVHAELESAVEAPRHWSTYAEHEPGDLIPGIAATYLYTFATSQHFIDGNKRTGAASADVFLQTNGYELSCASDELYETTLRAAEKLVSREFVIEWMRERIVARDPRDNG